MPTTRMRPTSDFYASAIARLEGYIDEEQNDARLGEAVVKIEDYTLAMREEGVDDIGNRKSRLVGLDRAGVLGSSILSARNMPIHAERNYSDHRCSFAKSCRRRGGLGNERPGR